MLEYLQGNNAFLLSGQWWADAWLLWHHQSIACFDLKDGLNEYNSPGQNATLQIPITGSTAM